MPLEDSVVLLDNLVNLQFLVSGVPKPDIQLFVDDKLVGDESDKFTLIRDGDKYVIEFKRKDPSNSGTYRVHAKNVVGEAVTECQLAVQGNS